MIPDQSLIGINPGVWGCHDLPRFWAGGRGGVARGVVVGRETFLYHIICRKYVRKWRLFKRNRI